ncbi:response regulator [Peloplasma aerotolerans]|uniref:Response regulator transcription factor n=1 Tax=Peloplasma aerotolerans TaxID=3044389 RepID=A0AAW6U6M0_9MOLU|nr:response regulator transcription factor [Mariniplasma sp. M4Ah]MDI6453608.1 response regulator transcription factor [Mariniplasma sp. M4Ah]MDR4968062.1 response regulator transcription factor [Acholeplasmataceae bacterium]
MKILLVDDDHLITDSLEIILSKDQSFQVVGKCANGLEAIEFIRTHHVDIILMDIRMPEMNGIDACAKIKEINQSIKIIMLTTFRDFRHVHQALHAGASGYLLKSEEVEQQIQTIKTVFQGQAIISEEALQEFTTSNRVQLLTDRENSCMELIAHGYSNKEIASRLYIGEGTVRNVISIILEKLMLRDRTQIAIYYWQTVQDDTNK